jgi:L-iditol 2-dehydrogenase
MMRLQIQAAKAKPMPRSTSCAGVEPTSCGESENFHTNQPVAYRLAISARSVSRPRELRSGAGSGTRDYVIGHRVGGLGSRATGGRSWSGQCDNDKRMDALLLKEYMNLEMVQMPEPEIGPEDILVRVRACGICGSDVHGLDGSTGRRIPPLVMGHEAAGEVAALGSAVKDLAIGDRVTFDSTIYCGKCYYCARGEVNLCDNREVMGVSPGPYRRHGAFAEFVAVPRRIVYKLPDNLGYEQAALIEAVSVAAHAVNLSGPPAEADDVAVVVGSGMIGLLTVQAVRAAGYTRVAAIDIDDAKLAMARKLGATESFNSKTSDAPAGVRELTGGGGGEVGV